MNWIRFWRHLRFRQQHAWWWKIAIGLLIWFFLLKGYAHAEVGTASYYNVASCLCEGTSGIMANGKELNDENLTCASWMHRFGTVLVVKNLLNGKTTKVVVTDRGPAKKLYRMGRIIDLSQRAMRELDGIKRGVIPVKVEVIK